MKIKNCFSHLTILFSDYQFAPKLHYVKIMFKTPKFERITKDRAAKGRLQKKTVNRVTLSLKVGRMVLHSLRGVRMSYVKIFPF